MNNGVRGSSVGSIMSKVLHRCSRTDVFWVASFWRFVGIPPDESLNYCSDADVPLFFSNLVLCLFSGILYVPGLLY